MRYFSVVSALAVFSVLSLIGCESSPTGPATVPESAIIGGWNVISGTFHGTITAGGMTIRMDTTVYMTGTNTAQYNSNHSFVYISDNSSSLPKLLMSAKIMALDTTTGTWSLSGNQLTTVSSTETSTSAVAVSGNNLSLTTQVNESDSSSGTIMTIKGTGTNAMVRQ